MYFLVLLVFTLYHFDFSNMHFLVNSDCRNENYNFISSKELGDSNCKERYAYFYRYVTYGTHKSSEGILLYSTSISSPYYKHMYTYYSYTVICFICIYTLAFLIDMCI